MELIPKQFHPDRTPWPTGVIEFEPTGDYYEDMDMYGIETVEGMEYIRPGDWVIADGHGNCVLIREAEYA